MTDNITINHSMDTIHVLDQDVNTIVTISEESTSATDNVGVYDVSIDNDIVSITLEDKTLFVSDADVNITPEFKEIVYIEPKTYNVNNNSFSCIAGSDLEEHRFIAIKDGVLVYADTSVATDADLVAGMTEVSGLLDESINTIISGEVIDLSWSWDITLPLYLSDNGLMTQTTPTTGFILIVGYPTSPTSIIVDIKTPILSEADIMYSSRVDFLDPVDGIETLYRGEALVGSNEANPVWRIRKITIGVDGDVTTLFADSNDNFDNIWNDRLTKTYG